MEETPSTGDRVRVVTPFSPVAGKAGTVTWVGGKNPTAPIIDVEIDGDRLPWTFQLHELESASD